MAGALSDTPGRLALGRPSRPDERPGECQRPGLIVKIGKSRSTTRSRVLSPWTSDRPLGSALFGDWPTRVLGRSATRYVDGLRTALVESNSIYAGTQAGLRPPPAAPLRLSASENESGKARKCSQKAGSYMTFKQQWLLADSVVAFILLLCLALMLMMLSSVRLP